MGLHGKNRAGWLAGRLGLAVLAPLAAAGEPDSVPDLAKAEWIWPLGKARVETTDVSWFRKKFSLPARPERATIVLTADNGFDLYINGRYVAGEGGADSSIWSTVERYRVEGYLMEGANVLAIRGENLGGPGGLIAAVRVVLPEGAEVSFATGASWLASTEAAPGWTETDHDDSLWSPAVELGRLGTEPWGALAVPVALSVKRRREGGADLFSEAPEDYPWPAGVVFVAGKVPLNSTPGAPQAKWPVQRSRAFFEHDTPTPPALGRRLVALIPARPDAEPRVLVDAGRGVLGSPTCSYDGQEIIFALAPAGEKFFKIFRIAADGTGLARLTRGPWHDYDPAVLPDGRIVFASTRIGSRDEYHGNAARSLFFLGADRSTVRPLTYHIVGDSEPVVTADGRIAFVRADNFMERAKVETHIHAVHPDGTSGEVLAGPDRRAIHYDRPSAAEDPARWLRNYGFGSPAPLPDGRLACLSHSGPIACGPGVEGTVRLRSDVSLFDISPLPDGRLLCSTVWRGALAILDPTSGRAVRLYSADTQDLHSVVYLGPRPKPPIVPARIRPEDEDRHDKTGFLLCLNVYESRQTAAEWRQVKAIRVFSADPLTTRPARHPYAHIGTEGVELGALPLAPDGSFYARVPADRALAIQAIDAEGRGVVNELSWIYVRPGEVRSCTGCHGHRGSASGAGALSARAAPVDLLPGARPHRFRANNAANGGVLNLQFDRFREIASIDLYSQAAPAPGSDPADLPAGRGSEVARLSRLLDRGTVGEKISAGRRLGILRNRAAVPALSRALRDEDRGVRLAAALALASCGHRHAVAPLLRALSDSSPPVAQAANLALENLTGHSESFNAYVGRDVQTAGAARWKGWIEARGWRSIEDDLVERLASGDHLLAHQAVEALGHVGSDRAREALRKFLESEAPNALITRIAAIRSLGHLRDEEAIPLLAKILRENIVEEPIRPRKSHEFGWAQRPVHLAGAAAEALGWIGTAEAESQLIRAFGDLAPFWYYTYRAGDHEWLKGCHSSLPHYRMAEALDAMGSRKARPIAGALLRAVPMDPDRGLLYENDAYEVLTARVIHRSGAGREVVDTCLAVLGDRDAAASPALTDAVRASPPAVSVGPLSPESRAAQLLSVVCLRPEDAPRVRSVLDRYRREGASRKRSWVCFFAARTLGKLRDKGSAKTLMDIVENDPTEASHGVPDAPNVFLHEAMTPLYRAAAADALGRIGAREAVPILLSAAANFDNAMDVRQAAARALLMIAAPGSLEDLEDLARDYPEIATRRTLREAHAAVRARNRGRSSDASSK